MSKKLFIFAKTIFLCFHKQKKNYLKSIYILEIDLNQSISTNLLAAKLQTKASSVTDMLKKIIL